LASGFSYSNYLSAADSISNFPAANQTSHLLKAAGWSTGYSVKVVAFSNAEESVAISSIVSSNDSAMSLSARMPWLACVVMLT
jgi:hypothetical protein